MGLCLGKTTSGDTSSTSPPLMDLPHELAGTSSSYPPWKDLPHELAGVVLSRLASHDDRFSFGGVCHDWRLAAKHQRPLLAPAMPCINLGKGEYQSLIDGKVRRFPMTSDARGDASFGGALVFEHDASSRCFLQDPFSGTRMPAIKLPCYYNWEPLRANDVVGTFKPHPGRGAPHSDVQKIVLLSPKLVTALFHGAPFLNYRNFGGFCPGTPPPLLWSEVADPLAGQHHGGTFCYEDVAFHLGKIFGICLGNLFAHEFFGDSLSKSHVEHVIKEQLNAVYMDMKCYLVTSADNTKLLMVRWSIIEVMKELKLDHHTMDLRVFEADLDKGRWSEVKDLGDQVLFVGQTGSRAFAVTGSADHYHQIFQRGNLVFLSGNDWSWKWELEKRSAQCKCFNCRKFVHGIPIYCVFDIMSGKSSIVSLSRSDSQKKYFRSEWFFPSA